MGKKTIAVIFGGRSPEYEVSLKSGYSIINAIDLDKYEVLMLGINRDGRWYRFTGDANDIPTDKWHTGGRFLKGAALSVSRGGGVLVFDGDRVESIQVDTVFPVLHGKYGEDGTVQGLCELSGVPVVGSGSAASALCMDKDRAHKLVSQAGIRVPESVCFEYEPALEEVSKAISGMKTPLFVKSVKTGSSVGITKIGSMEELGGAVRKALSFDDAFIIEECIGGFEAGCAVVGNHELITGRIDEIELAGGFFDYEEKYTLKTAKIHLPARIDPDTERRLQETAKAIYRILGCRGYARVDMFLTGENEIVFNEANTIPGFTRHSRFPKMMDGVGVGFTELVGMLIELAQ